MNRRVMLQKPEVIGALEDIRDPDKYIDALAPAFTGNAERIARFEAIKSLDHANKVRWLLSQEDESDEKLTPLAPAVVCTLIIVTTVVLVIIGYEIVNGIKKAITEKRTEEKEVKKCVPLDE